VLSHCAGRRDFQTKTEFRLVQVYLISKPASCDSKELKVQFGLIDAVCRGLQRLQSGDLKLALLLTNPITLILYRRDPKSGKTHTHTHTHASGGLRGEGEIHLYSLSHSWGNRLHFRLFPFMNRDSAVDITTGYGLDVGEVGVRVPVGTRIFISLCRSE
jgi:hypothetical protein